MPNEEKESIYRKAYETQRMTPDTVDVRAYKNQTWQQSF